MIPPALLTPTVSHALVLATPTLLRSAALITPAAVGFSQSRTCFSFFRNRRNGSSRRRDQQCTYVAQERYFGVSEDMKRERHRRDGEHTVEKWQRDFEGKVEEMRARQTLARQELMRKWLAMDPYEVLFGKSEKMLKGVNSTNWHWSEFWHRQRGEKGWPEVPISQKWNIQEAKHEMMPESDQLEMEYDPISNRMRMVTKSEKVMSHYGQELDTANDIPVKPPPRPKPSQYITKASPSVSDVQAELRQYKEKRIPDVSVSFEMSAETGKEPIVQGTKVEDGVKSSFSIASAADRAKLEESFAKIQKELVESWNQISIPGQLKALHKLSSEVTNLGDTILKISNNMDSSIASGEKAAVSENLAKQESKANATTGLESTKVQAETLKDLSNQVTELGRRLARISNKVAASKDGISKDADVFPMLFGEKTPFKETKLSMEESDQALQEEVKKLKEAMKFAEESDKLYEDPRMNDTELQNELRNIYEREYGEIQATQELPPYSTTQTSEVHKTLQNTSRPQELPLSTQTEELNTPTQPTETVSSQSEATPVPEKDTIYTVLAYDPSTSEVTTTTLLAPVSAEETSMPLTVALTHLSEPAKFLPHLRLLRENNSRAVSVTKNLLVLRGTSPFPVPNATNVKKAVVEQPTKQKEAQTSHDQSSIASQTSDNSRPAKRLEPFYTGSKQEKHYYRRRGDRSFWRDMLSFTIKYVMITGAVIYLLGLKDGMKKVPVPKQAITGELERQEKKNK